MFIIEVVLSGSDVLGCIILSAIPNILPTLMYVNGVDNINQYYTP